MFFLESEGWAVTAEKLSIPADNTKATLDKLLREL